ncbi:DNA-binding SARP family transcriptional activator/predicted negative regulator of RcsB-dependent stress response/energy-coupling factor transporter ATP-binding protein EcfA2 [Saccharothrix ecbatanensis]|uniref:DNA-binding SARP family transcriptional activator/predicted negative regulator of RcsB-dependent stress response/energy-coupling factor transporter ATP-binding protein EcfA2 n=1 Tax=Saccharothrix ecbatanensis TaxID=1105145 RepID=A0A7W9HTI7_9PSEU|nr:BTAD domain-containing putative transcriptional regulator [Saccharothrix ecbatanensis]MBB5808174.1 DNA-binding SARP family transcriptional activator/predicted negative regulator of RcsB-dependent stress response/energy-coupling factor transporter ATP-binding protein EcfA2 [Saccharothrix ecbatanensis]
MEFKVLGPVEAWVDGSLVAVGGPKPKTLLALLAIHAGRVVSLDQLVDAMWGEQPPDQSRSAIYTYVSSLRRELGDVLSRSGGGYLLSADLDEVDLHVFTSEVTEGRKALAEGDLKGAAVRFATALGAWRGTPLGGAQGAWAEGERSRLEEMRLAALEDRFDADLAIGRGEPLVAELSAAVAENPLRERLRSQLMLALHQAGRQADALACYQEGRRVLLDELGLEPGPALRATHERVLRGDADTRSADARSADAASRAAPTPSQLPFDIGDFTGRVAEQERLVARLTAETGAAQVCAISGQPGAGKSTLAAHVAHVVRDHFADGQLYANLRGVQVVPADPAEVLAGFLRALGVADPAIPAELEERSQLYRTLVADRRVLIVLDDARDERQIRPLLPGGATCALLVSSRERLGALSGAAQLHLRVLRDDEAVELLDRVVGDDRVPAEPDAAEEIVRLCGNLPLALRIAGARLAARPQWKLSRLAERLGVQRRVLQELTLGDLEVRGSLALSYDGLGERERTALRRLGLLDVSTFGGWLLAPLLDCDPDEAEEVVERLVDSQLLDIATTDDGAALRYRLHDLTRAFARERGEAEEPLEQARAACARAAEAWLSLVELAGSRMSHANFGGTPVALDPRYFDGAVADDVIADPEGWFDAEQSGLVRVVERVSELDLTDVATRLAATLCSSRFSVRNLFGQWRRTHSSALEAARRTGDRAGEARLLSGLGWLSYEQDRFDEAASYYGQALDAFQEGDDALGEAATRLSLSTVLRERGELDRAVELLDQALAVLRSYDEPGLVAQALHGLGRVLTERGALDQALEKCSQTLDSYRESGDRRSEAIALRSVGIVHRAAGRWDEAAEYCAEAVRVLQALDDRLMSAYAVQALAKVRIRQGRADAVRSDLFECLSTCGEMQDDFGQALVLRTLGELEIAAGRPDMARRYLDQALHRWAALSLPVWRARTLRDLSTALTALGEPAAADEAWTEALRIFVAHGGREAREPRPSTTAVPGRTSWTDSVKVS